MRKCCLIKPNYRAKGQCCLIRFGSKVEGEHCLIKPSYWPKKKQCLINLVINQKRSTSSRALVERKKVLLDKETKLQKKELHLVPQLYHIRLYCIKTGTNIQLILYFIFYHVRIFKCHLVNKFWLSFLQGVNEAKQGINLAVP